MRQGRFGEPASETAQLYSEWVSVWRNRRNVAAQIARWRSLR